MKKPRVLSYLLSAQRKLRPDWSESSLGAQSFCRFCHVAAHTSRLWVWCGNYVFYTVCFSIVIPNERKRELVSVLAVFLVVSRFTTTPLDARGRLRCLIVALPGDLLWHATLQSKNWLWKVYFVRFLPLLVDSDPPMCPGPSLWKARTDCTNTNLGHQGSLRHSFCIWNKTETTQRSRAIVRIIYININDAKWM